MSGSPVTKEHVVIQIQFFSVDIAMALPWLMGIRAELCRPAVPCKKTNKNCDWHRGSHEEHDNQSPSVAMFHASRPMLVARTTFCARNAVYCGTVCPLNRGDATSPRTSRSAGPAWRTIFLGKHFPLPRAHRFQISLLSRCDAGRIAHLDPDTARVRSIGAVDPLRHDAPQRQGTHGRTR